MTRRASFGLLLMVMSMIASAAYAQDHDHISTTVGIDIAGFTVTSTGTVSYDCIDIIRHACGTWGGSNLIADGAVGTVAEVKYQGMTDRQYTSTVGASTIYEHCYRSTMAATGEYGSSQSSGSAMKCAPPEPPPPPPPDGGGVPIMCDPGHPPCGGNGTSDEPLILDLNGDGIHTTRLEDAAVLFDMNADGTPDRTAWTDPETEEGFLFYDRNHNHLIDGNAELFGNRTPLPDGTIAASGVEALAAYDKRENHGNNDGVIGPGDSVWGILRVWVDRDHDGVATEAETYSLGSLGVEAINLQFERVGSDRSYGIDDSGNFHVLQGSFRQRLRGRAGVVDRAIHDVFFRVQYQ